ncbi:MAG: right-handed parallel beta-helix repeat-containing protein, partial [Planctomycetes bacterium]|nr:right-handed parallel beta-helix repeat-containing protein [Planctomycetota bacterium]
MFSRLPRICIFSLLVFVAFRPDIARGQLFVPPPGPEFVEVEESPGYPIRYSIQYFAGSMPGIDSGFTQLGMFIPLGEIAGDSLLFCDLQPVFDGDGNVGSNLGLGFRFYEPSMERVFGLYGYVDYRQTNYSSFKQLTLGFDSLGTLVDLRGNLYLPDRKPQGLPARSVRDPRFVGHQLLFGGYEYAMPGADLEAGLVLPPFYLTQSRLFGGVYHFDTDGSGNATGLRLRLETHWTANISTDVAIYHDDEFGTTGFVGIGLNWQPESHSRWKPQITSFRRGPERHITLHASDRLAEPTHRIPSIAVGREAYVARDGSHPWRIVHVVEGATGGNGSIANPFGTMEQALAVARPGDIVYTPHGGVYQPGGLLVVPEAVNLFSNLNPHWIETQHGYVQLPFSGQVGPLVTPPEIHSSVYLSDGVTIDGFRLVGAGDTPELAGTIRSTGSADLRIYGNFVQSRQHGIWLDGVNGADIWGNTIESAVDSGLLVENSSLVLIERNQVLYSGGNGIDIAGTNSAWINRNEINEAGGSGIRAIGGDGATI